MLASYESYRARRHAPVARLAEPHTRRSPVWPTFSIALVLCAAVVLTPLLLTILNAMLVALAAAVVLIGNRKLDRPIFHLVVPFGLIGFLGLATGVGASRYEYFKDLWYVLNPLLVVLTGYILYLAKPDLNRGLRAFVIGGLIVAVWQMRGYFVDPSIILLPAATIRSVVGTGFYAPVLALAIFIVYAGHWKSDLKLPSVLAGAIFVVLSLAVVGVFSRTAVVVVAIAVAATLGCFAKREWLRVGFPSIVFVLIMYVVGLYIDTQSDEALLSFGAKFVRSLSEIAASDYSLARDINVNYRGYETQRALDQFAGSDVMQMLFGQGFGAMVDLRVNLPLGLSETGGRYTRFIPVLHNGYMYLLTKVGLVGLLLFIYFLGYLYIVGRAGSGLTPPDSRIRAGRLLQAVALTLALTTYIIAGVFNKFDMFPFLLMTGYLLAHSRGSSEDLAGLPERASGVRGAAGRPQPAEVQP